MKRLRKYIIAIILLGMLVTPALAQNCAWVDEIIPLRGETLPERVESFADFIINSDLGNYQKITINESWRYVVISWQICEEMPESTD
jgi:hypothetical protein